MLSTDLPKECSKCHRELDPEEIEYERKRRGEQWCEECRALSRSWEHRRTEGRRGTPYCNECGIDTLLDPLRRYLGEAAEICSTCIFKLTSNKHFHTTARWVELCDLFLAQEGRSAMTGCPLLLRGNASLDHRIPLKRGGTHARTNLQWVTKIENLIKSKCTEEELEEFFDQFKRWRMSPEYQAMKRRMYRVQDDDRTFAD